MPDRLGWTCPVCNRGVSPDEKTCNHDNMASLPPTFVPPYKPGHWGWPAPATSGGALEVPQHEKDIDCYISSDIEQKARRLFDGDSRHQSESTFYSQATARTRNAYRKMAQEQSGDDESKHETFEEMAARVLNKPFDDPAP